MGRLRFSDGVEFDTSGKLRVEGRHDGYYVLGEGMAIPVDNKDEGYSLIRELNKEKEEVNAD